MEDLTKRAYNYAVDKKKVNQGVIEAFKDAYSTGYGDSVKRPNIELLKIVRARYRSSKQVEYDLGMSDARRNANEQELAEIKKHELLDELIKQFEKLK